MYKEFRQRKWKEVKDWMVQGKGRNIKPPQKFAQNMNHCDYAETIGATNSVAGESGLLGSDSVSIGK